MNRLIAGLFLTPALLTPALAQTPPADVNAMLSAKYVFGTADPAVRAALGRPEQDAAASLRVRVAAGNWQAVNGTLAALLPGEAARVHARIAEALLATPAAADGMLPDDVADFIATLPPAAPVGRPHVEALGKLLARTAGGRPVPPAIVDRIAAVGQEHGGAQLFTVPLLLAAGQPKSALPLLPDDAAVLASGDGVWLDDVLACRAAVLLQNGGSAGWAELLSLAIEASARRQTALSTDAGITRVIAYAENAGQPAMLDGWLDDLAKNQPDAYQQTLRLAARPLSPGDVPTDASRRFDRMRVQRRILSRATSVDTDTVSFNDLLAANWLAEANFKPAPPPPPGPRFPDQPAPPSPPAEQAIAAAQLLAAMPSPAGLSPGLREATRRAMFNLQVITGAFDPAIDTLGAIVSQSPSSAGPLSASLLSAWTRQYGAAVEIPTGPTFSRKLVLPVAEAVQKRNVAELARIVSRLRHLLPTAVPADALVKAYIDVHAPTGGYAEDELVSVFGPFATMDVDTAVQLATTWRTALRRFGMESSPAVKASPAGDTSGAYRTLQKLMRDRAATAADSRLDLQFGLSLFEQADYVLARPTPGIEASSLRREALNVLARCASRSNTAAPQTTAAAYLQWFNCAIGLSDPSMTAVGQLVPDYGELARLRDTVAALPPELGSRIFDQLAAAMSQQSRSVGAERVALYTKAALTVVGDNPAANPMKLASAYYDGLTAEVRLVTEVDGSPEIGQMSPFGVRVSLDTTKQLDREVRGFSKILAGRSHTQLAGTSLTGRVEYRNRLEKSIRRAWDQSLTIDSILWADQDDAAEPIGDTGWQRDAIAYVVARAKSPAVDVLPPVQLDLDFGDRASGDSVILPFVAAPLAVDAGRFADRPSRVLEVRHLLNERDLATDSTVTDEITVSAAGMVPALDKLFDVHDGATVRSVEDRGLKANEYDASAADRAPSVRTGRTWLVTYEVPKDASRTFDFAALLPAAAKDGPTVKYQRYAGSDVVDVDRTVSLDSATRGRAVTAVVIGIAIAAFLVALLFALNRLRQKRAGRPVVEEDSPKTLSAFAALDQLTRLRSQSAGMLPPEDVERLNADIRAIERQYGRSTLTGDASENAGFATVVDRWKKVTAYQGN